MAGSRQSAERVRRGATSGHGPYESRKKPVLHLFLSGLCDTVGVNYREKNMHILLASLTQMWQEEDRRVDPMPCSFRKDGEIKRREGCWLDGWSSSPFLLLSCFMMLVSFCAMLMRSTGEEDWRLSNPLSFPRFDTAGQKQTLAHTVCVCVCVCVYFFVHIWTVSVTTSPV